jgi:hypothetical protein
MKFSENEISFQLAGPVVCSIPPGPPTVFKSLWHIFYEAVFKVFAVEIRHGRCLTVFLSLSLSLFRCVRRARKLKPVGQFVLEGNLVVRSISEICCSVDVIGSLLHGLVAVQRKTWSSLPCTRSVSLRFSRFVTVSCSIFQMPSNSPIECVSCGSANKPRLFPWTDVQAVQLWAGWPLSGSRQG